MRAPSALTLEFPECLRDDFADELPLAFAVTDDVVRSLEGRDLRPLAVRSPGLTDFDWVNYLRCSIVRLVHASAAIKRRGVVAGSVLDCGAYFGNFSLLFRRLGFTVDAVDAFGAYGAAMVDSVRLLEQERVRIIDFEDVGFDLSGLPDASYDLVMCGGVIEHVPHTPRPLLEAFARVLRPGGVLVLDTPNQAYVYNRQKLIRGESIMAPIAQQFLSEGAFEGHHREFTAAEGVWMLETVGYTSISVELFNYSLYGLSELRGRDLANYWTSVADPSSREVLMMAAHTPRGPLAEVTHQDWQNLYIETEPSSRRRLLEAGFTAAIDGGDQEIAHLVEEVERRDKLLADLAEHVRRDVELRDRMLADRDRLVRDVEVRLQHEIAERDRLLEDTRRRVDRLTGRALLRYAKSRLSRVLGR